MDFIFVHGGCHDGWCWHLVRAVLESQGHRTWAPDMPVEDITAGIENYARVIVEGSRSAGSRTVIVGHSMGGLVIPVVASMRPAAQIVFVDASVPIPGRPFIEQMEDADYAPLSVRSAMSLDDLGRIVFLEREKTIDAFYHDCPADLTMEALRHLRPQAMTPFTQASPLSSWPTVSTKFVHCREDRATGIDYENRVAREHFGVEITELQGGHSPFFSRPGELSRVLLEFAAEVQPQ